MHALHDDIRTYFGSGEPSEHDIPAPVGTNLQELYWRWNGNEFEKIIR